MLVVLCVSVEYDKIMAKLIPFVLKSKVMSLRKKGYSYHEIKREVQVSYGSISRLAKNVLIPKRYLKRLENRRLSSVVRKNTALRIAAKESNILIKKLTIKEKHIILACLYWGEGGKTDFNFTNTDPAMVNVFVTLLKEVLNLNISRFRVSVRIYEDMDREKCINYWSKVTGVPAQDFAGINVLKGKKQGKLEYGMCRVRLIKGGDVLKLFTAIKQRLSSVVTNPYSSTDRAQVS